MTYGEILFRTAMSFIALLVLTRLLGKKQVGHLTFFNYVTGITFGSTTAEIIVTREITLLQGISSLVLWSLMAFIIAWIGLRSVKAREILDGQPTILVKQGMILEKALAKQHLNIDDLSMLLRNKDIFSPEEVEFAILEPDGRLSVLKKEELLPATKKDIKAATMPVHKIPTELIVDGTIVEKNLAKMDVSAVWLGKQLKKEGIDSVDQVFYAELQLDGTLYIDKYRDSIQ
ncbi:YetF domain-containing protein [Paenibacillus sp. SN-8-1]|uniref:YetF domain-containing protein n=1 Tax=Paenibacillus sp. SN-8-1 TaxID=3435409 RepID=UPI003D9A5D22